MAAASQVYYNYNIIGEMKRDKKLVLEGPVMMSVVIST
jgi:hypothetical protein